LGSEENNFLAALGARFGAAVGLAALDLSTGEFFAPTEFSRCLTPSARIVEELQQLRPR